MSDDIALAESKMYSFGDQSMEFVRCPHIPCINR